MSARLLSIIIPTYNERGNIQPLVSRLEHSLLGIPHELIFVDDNSPDGTADAIRAFASNNPDVRLVERSGKLGLTSAVVAGVDAAHGDVIAVMDADLSHPPETIPELVKAIDAGADIVVGSRLTKGGKVENWPLHRKMISRGADFLARMILAAKSTDPMSGLFAARREIFERTRFRTRGYKLLLNIIFDNPHAKVAEIPYVFRDRNAGKTKLGAKEIATYTSDIFRVRFG